MSFLEIDAVTVEDLGRFGEFIEPHLEWLLDRFYARMLARDETKDMFGSAETLDRVRAAQRRHWSERVFAGCFDVDYLVSVRAMGRAHFRVGVDSAMLSSGYCFVLNDIGILVEREEPMEWPMKAQLTRAARKSVFLDLGLVNEVYHETHFTQLSEMTDGLLQSLARVGEYRDDDTGRHVQRVGAMCRELALAAGQSEAWADQFEVASRLHDLGKVGIPDSILFKPGPLDQIEVELMRLHPEVGADIIPDTTHPVLRTARQVALTHHERWDGTGYPNGLAGVEIPLEGRLTSICDVYDALLTKRPYKEPWPAERAVEFIRDNAGTMFDPNLVDCFMRILPKIGRLQQAYREVSFEAEAALEA